jgi:RHS repeat-associated protein
LRSSLTNGDGTTSYGYDADGQLTSASYPSASGLGNESFNYDGIGDQTQASQSYDGAGRLTADATFTYTYDGEGDLLTRTNKSTHEVTSYTWNSAHQLLAVTAPDATQTSFGYDPLGRRTDVTTVSGRVHTVYSGDQPIATYDTAGVLTASFVYGAGQNEQREETLPGTGTYDYLHDALGSVTALTSSSGAVVDSYRYTAFGQAHATGTVANPFTYIGAPTDPTTGLVYLNARYLDPTSGRFVSEDPIPAPSMYAYVTDDPTNLADPSGREGEGFEDLEVAQGLSEEVDREDFETTK